MKSAHSSIPGLGEFLAEYPLMSFRPRAGRPPVVRGRFAFTARHRKVGEISDAFELEIEIPPSFPKGAPIVTETGGRIPKEADSHVNPADGTLCLGSPLRLLQLLSEQPTLSGFAEKCLIPYLFAQSRKLAGSSTFAFGELEHGLSGMLDDYVALFGLKNINQALDALQMLGMKKRRANKLACPCGCGKRLSRCTFNSKLRRIRPVATRTWFRTEYKVILETAKLISERIAKAKAQQSLEVRVAPEERANA